jgi:hypothetical protein
MMLIKVDTAVDTRVVIAVEKMVVITVLPYDHDHGSPYIYIHVVYIKTK